MAGVVLPSTANPAVNRSWNRMEGRQLPNGRWIATVNPTAYNATNDGGPPFYDASRKRLWIVRYDDSIPPQPLAYQEIEADWVSLSTLAVLPSGGLLLIYDTFDIFGTHALQYRQSWDGGISWNAAVNLVTGQWSASLPRAEVDTQGRVYISVYLQTTGGSPIYRLIVGTVDSAGAWVWDYSGSEGLSAANFLYASREADLWGNDRVYSVQSSGNFAVDALWIGSGGYASFGEGAFFPPRGAFLRGQRNTLHDPLIPMVDLSWWELNSTGTQFAYTPAKDTDGQPDLAYDTLLNISTTHCYLQFGREGRAYFWFCERTSQELVLKICDRILPFTENNWY